MDRTYKKFLNSGIDLASVGVKRSEDNTAYFCTPKNASIFGWTGVDGIHFCFIRGFGAMVFAVSPTNASPDYVHPLAKDFADFLRLILACGDVSVLEQAWMWNESQFETFMSENPITEKQVQTLSEISEKMKLTPIEYPWVYIKELQSLFDYSKIKYTEDYYDTDLNPAAEQAFPEWKVYFNGNFGWHRGRDHAGSEIRLNKEFEWAGYHWLIPSAYSCSKGIVVDFCMRVDSENIRNFIRKWNLDLENDSYDNFTREQQLQMEWENPLCFHFSPCLKLNEKLLQTTHGCAVSFNPCFPAENNDPEAKRAVEHYELDNSYGWVICRSAFPWIGRRRPELKSLSVIMEQQPGRLPGPHFKVHAAGDSFVFSHPISGKQYNLTVLEIERQTVPVSAFGSDGWIYPTHCTAMTYTLFPEPSEDIAVYDCADGDSPRKISDNENSFHPVSKSSCCVAVLGMRYSPSETASDGTFQKNCHAACSALHFDPVADGVEWRIVFNVKQFDEASFSLI